MDLLAAPFLIFSTTVHPATTLRGRGCARNRRRWADCYSGREAHPSPIGWYRCSWAQTTIWAAIPAITAFTMRVQAGRCGSYRQRPTAAPSQTYSAPAGMPMRSRWGAAWRGCSTATRSRIQNFMGLQKEARQAARGLWAESQPVPPWEWRQRSTSEHQRNVVTRPAQTASPQPWEVRRKL